MRSQQFYIGDEEVFEGTQEFYIGDEAGRVENLGHLNVIWCKRSEDLKLELNKPFRMCLR